MKLLLGPITRTPAVGRVFDPPKLRSLTCRVLALSCLWQLAVHAAAPTGPFPTWKHLSSAKEDLPKPNGGKNQTSLLVLDIDRDGANDIVVAERSGAPSVVWLRRERNGWSRHVIDDTKVPIA